MQTSHSTVDTRSDAVVVTTGNLVSVFRKGDDLAAASQIASLHTQIEQLQALCERARYIARELWNEELDVLTQGDLEWLEPKATPPSGG